MSLQHVEYVLRVVMAEPVDDPAVPEESRIGEQMADLFMAIEEAAIDQEIISRVVDPDRPRRVRCAARSLDPQLHYATSRRWQIAMPDGETVTVCSAACAVSWLCEQVPTDVEASDTVQTGKEGTAA